MIRERIEERFGGLNRGELIGLAILAVAVVGGAAFWYVRSLPSRIQISTAAAPGQRRSRAPASGGSSSSPTPAEIVVDVAGWVNHPGVYRFHQGDRVIDAIQRAGGARSRADLQSINLAALLTDAQQIVVYRQGHAGAGPPSGSTAGSGSTGSGSSSVAQPVNINTATLDQLESLPGIGPVLGQKIIDYRLQHGPYRAIEDLLNVAGIGDKRFADLKPHITV